ncbi:MAG: DUF3857 domain-containing protein [Saprospiraceae bacterium]|nr:DUF3857 domain-containing protein [Saprospiraceae bacterium]
MKKIILQLIFGSFFIQNIHAQVSENSYAVSTIPTELLTNANAVVRRHDVNFLIKNIGEAVETEHRVITILNEKGKHYGEADFAYDKFNEIDDIEAAIFDGSGKLVT